jgi:hypothetical protein
MHVTIVKAANMMLVKRNEVGLRVFGWSESTDATDKADKIRIVAE